MPQFKYPIVDPGLDTAPSKYPSISPLIKPDMVYARNCAWPAPRED
jgi:hypothetical protein